MPAFALPSPTTVCTALALAMLMANAHAADTASSCAATATRVAAPPRALAMAAAARHEHLLFGGQTLDAQGRLTEAGAFEAEDAMALPGVTVPWRRVLDYWRAVDTADRGLPSQVRFGALRPADRGLLKQALNQASTARLQGLGVGTDQGLDAAELRAATTALDRVAVMDTPWSAAFVSWLAQQAGLGPEEFAFSEAHVDYAGAAWQAAMAEVAGRPTPYAMRACDLATTTPRTGDLVCHARGASADLDSFERIGAVLADRPTGGRALPMHCDVVVAVDATGFDAVGGNVLQSVSLRRLDFAPGTTRLDPSYRPDGCAATAATESRCTERHMSRQPWSLLLQWR